MVRRYVHYASSQAMVQGKILSPVDQLDIKKLKINWDKKGKKPDKFKLDGELDVVNDVSGVVTVTLLISMTAGGHLQGTETVTCKVNNHRWE